MSTRSWLCTQPELRGEIERLRDLQAPRTADIPAVPAPGASVVNSPWRCAIDGLADTQHIVRRE
jgi:hypothetical protein